VTPSDAYKNAVGNRLLAESLVADDGFRRVIVEVARRKGRRS